MLMNSQMPLMLTLATRNALHTCAAIIAKQHGLVVVVSSKEGMAQALRECLRTTPGVDFLIFPTGIHAVAESRQVDLEQDFGLTWIDPVQSQWNDVSRLLDHPRLRWLTILESSRLGRRMLAEWRPSGGSPLPRLTTTQIFNAFPFTSYQEFVIGNWRSIIWGIAAGRMKQMQRPDLADRCLARMRCYLTPSDKRWFLPYLFVRTAFYEADL